MRIAIFHDYLTNKGGGERVTLALAKHLKADVITTVYEPESTFSGFKDINVITKGFFPFRVKGLFHIELKNAFSRMKLEGYDFYIFSGTWCLFASKNHKPNLWYCHTPVRFVYDLYPLILKRLDFSRRLLFIVFSRWLRNADKKAVKNIGKIICNSNNVLNRVRKYYSRDAITVNPPIKARSRRIGKYFLTVNRIRPEKRLDLQIRAFNEMKDENLKVVGGAKNKTEKDYLDYLKSIASDNVEFLGAVSDNELNDLYSHCRAVIYTPIDEDFGLVPLEANTYGKPVIAVKEGGCLETVIDGKTGMLISANEQEIIHAVKSMTSKKTREMRKNCINNAKKFSEKNFIKRIEKEILQSS